MYRERERDLYKTISPNVWLRLPNRDATVARRRIWPCVQPMHCHSCLQKSSSVTSQ